MRDKTPAQLRREQRFWELQNQIAQHGGDTGWVDKLNDISFDPEQYERDQLRRSLQKSFERRGR